MSLWILTNGNALNVAQDLRKICPDPALTIDLGQHADGSYGGGIVSFQPAPTVGGVGAEMVQLLVGSTAVSVGIRGETDAWSERPVPGYILENVGGVTLPDKYPSATLVEIVYNISPCGGNGIWVTDSSNNHISAPTDVALFHEMAHAHDIITGVWANNAAVDEPRALAQENQYRTSQGLAQRSGHSGGCNPAPAQPAPARSSHCFIATAAFGSPSEPEVQMLRGFRDNVLRKTRAGRLFFDTYWKHYYRVSPFVVNAMQQDPEVKEVVRWSVVTPIVRYLELLLSFPDASLDAIQEPWHSFLVRLRDDLETWTSEIELPRTFRELDAPSAAQELAIILRYVLRTAGKKADYLRDLEQRGEIPLAGSACQLARAAKHLRQCSVPELDVARLVQSRETPPLRSASPYMNEDEVILEYGAGADPSFDVYQVVITCLTPFDQIALFYNQNDYPNNVYFQAENNIQTGQVVIFNLCACDLLNSYTIGFFVADQLVTQIPNDDPIFQGQSVITPALDQEIHATDPPCKSAWSIS
jgi:hypothetical protein